MNVSCLFFDENDDVCFAEVLTVTSLTETKTYSYSIAATDSVGNVAIPVGETNKPIVQANSFAPVIASCSVTALYGRSKFLGEAAGHLVGVDRGLAQAQSRRSPRDGERLGGNVDDRLLCQ